MSAAFVLPEGAVAGTGPVNFPGFPGMWTPGVPVEAAEFVRVGAFVSVDEMAATVSELGLPLEPVTVEAGSAPMPARANHALSTRQARAAQETERKAARAEKRRAAKADTGGES